LGFCFDTFYFIKKNSKNSFSNVKCFFSRKIATLMKSKKLWIFFLFSKIWDDKLGKGGGSRGGGTGQGSEGKVFFFFRFFWVLPLFLGGGWSGVSTGYQHSSTLLIALVRLSVYDVIVLALHSMVEPASTFSMAEPALVFFPPFSGRLPRVNTRVFFSPPFSGGLPRVNTKVFFPALL
jgi:hypothetical protein